MTTFDTLSSEAPPTLDLEAETTRAPPPPVKKTIDLQSKDAFPSLPSLGSGVKNGSMLSKPMAAPLGIFKAAVTSSSSAGGLTGSVPRGKTTTERFEILEQHLAKKQLGQTISEICKSVMTKNSVSIELSTNKRTGTLTLIVTGDKEKVQWSRRDLLSQLSVPVTETLMIPSSCRPHLIGKGGSNLKALTLKTCTKINVPRSDANKESAEDDGAVTELSADEQPVTITGDPTGVSLAKKEILDLVAEKTSKLFLRLTFEHTFHPFIAQSASAIETETGAKIHIPPYLANEAEQKDEISVQGDREGVLIAEEKLKALYEELKKNIRTVALPVSKRQHRFIIGQKGAGIQDILQKTQCSVQVPALLDPSEIVTIRGEDQKLSLALQAVLEKANSVTVAQVDVATWIPKSIDSQLYLQYLYTRARSTLKKIESDYNVVIHRQSGEGAFLELQGNVKQETEAAREALTSLLATHGQTLYMAHASIPQELHRYVIGKGGQNIVKLKSRAEFQGRLVDLILPNEDEDSDKILMIIQRMPYAGAKELKSSDEEAVLVIHEMATALIQDASQASDFTSLTLAVDSKYHGRLIGAGGAALKELLGPLVETSSVRFPHADSKSSEGKTSAVAKDSVLIKGPSKNVTEIVSKIQSLVSDWKKLDSLINFSETVKVEEGMLHKLFSLNEGLEGVLPMSSIGWVVRGVRDSIAANSKLMATMEKDKDNLYAGNYHLRLELPSSSQKDTVVVFGPKLAVPLATEVIKARAQKILDTATEVFSIFEAPEIAELVLADPTIMDRTLRRVIGKEGKNIKKLTDKYGVQLKFMRGNRDTNGLPSAEDANGDSTEDVSPTDDASPEKTPGLVKIKGIKSDVEDAKLELLSLVEHEVKRSNVLIFSIPIQVLPHVLGRGGSKSTKLKEEFDAYMDFEDDGEEARVTLEGSKENCIAVHKVILDIADGVTNLATTTIIIPAHLHKHIIGPAGATVKAVIDSMGGPEKVTVLFPKHGGSMALSSDEITLRGHSSLLPELKKAFDKVVCDFLKSGSETKWSNFTDLYASGVSDCAVLPSVDIGRVIGRGGDGLTEIMKKFNVALFVSDNVGTEPSSVNVSIRGYSDEQVKLAKQHLAGKIRQSETVPLPEFMSNRVAGQTSTAPFILEAARKLRQDYSVSLEISAASAPGAVTVYGTKSQLPQAIAALNKRFDEWAITHHMATRPIVKEFCRHIIGRGGETLKKIRTESGANVDLHRTDGTADDILLICGATASSIDSALLMVQNILEDQERRMSDRLKAEAEVKVFKESVEAEAKAASQVHVPVKSQFPPGYSGRLEKSRVGKKKQDYASSAVTLTHTPPAMSVAQSQKSSNGWQSVTNKKTRKVENPGAIPVGVAGTAVQEKTVVGAPAKLTSQKAKSAEVKPNPNQPKDAHAKIAEVKKDDSVQVANASEKTSPRMRGNVSVADTIVSIADTLVMPSSDYKIEAVKADEWQTIKKGKVVKADEDSDVKTSSKKKKKKKKAKEVDGQEVGNTATLSAQ